MNPFSNILNGWISDNEVRVKLNEYQIVHSGTLLFKEHDTAYITLPDQKEGEYYFTLEFLEGNEKDQTKVDVIDSHHIKISFLCAENSSPYTSSSQLIPLGSLMYKKLYFRFSRIEMGSAGRMLFYQFLVGEEEVGQEEKI